MAGRHRMRLRGNDNKRGVGVGLKRIVFQEEERQAERQRNRIKADAKKVLRSCVPLRCASASVSLCVVVQGPFLHACEHVCPTYHWGEILKQNFDPLLALAATEAAFNKSVWAVELTEVFFF